MSVMMKITGQSITPAVRLNPSPSTPSIVKSNGSKPKVASKENIFPPIISATNAVVTNMPANTVNSLTLL